MAYDQTLAERVRSALARHGVVEKKMFGGLAFMLRGNMCCGVLRDDLIVRVGPQKFAQALSMPHARPMDITGRPMKGFVMVGPAGYGTDEALTQWITLGVDSAGSLPP